MMRSVQVLLSSYNGEKYIGRQVDSILRQQNVDIRLLIRDDGSQDGTRKIISEYQKKYPNQIEVILGENIGYKKSFFKLLTMAGKYDYYAFADQDDYWLENKEMDSIQKMEEDNYDGPQLAQTNFESVHEDLVPIMPQPPHYHLLGIKYHDQIYAGDFFQGCLMTWNNQAMKLLLRYQPKGDYSHDHWVGRVCYLLGKIYFVKKKSLLYVRHDHNASATDDQWKGRLLRLKSLLHGKEHIYDNFGQDMLDGYGDLMSLHDCKMCQDFNSYKSSFASKKRLLFNRCLGRTSLAGTLFYKLNLLLNRI